MKGSALRPGDGLSRSSRGDVSLGVVNRHQNADREAHESHRN